jgi:hypothetical protein
VLILTSERKENNLSSKWGVLGKADVWEWLQGLSGGAATFVGSLTGSAIGLIAILIGALFNARLNRRRDDELRKKETRGVAAALKAELAGRSSSLLDNAKQLENLQGDSFVVPDIAQSIRVMPDLTSKLGLLDENTIEIVINAYVVIEQYCDRLILDGGKLIGLPGKRRSVLMDARLAPRVKGANLGVNDAIQKAIEKLDTYLH